MYIARSLDLSNPENTSKGVSKGELKIKREQEVRKAKKKIKETIDGWHKMYRGEKDNKGYFYVGEILRDPGWLEKLPKRELCDAAQQSRPETVRDD
jgi:hypothetical protein